MYKYSFGKIWRSAILTAMFGGALSTATSCGENNKNEDPGPVKESIVFTQESVSIPIEGEGTVSLTVTPVEKIEEVEVKVADEDVIEVSRKTDAKGYVFTMKAKALGSTTIVAVLGSSIAKCAVTVDPIAVTGISLNKTSMQLFVGESETLSATITPDNATSPSISWDSSDKEVATVENGVVKAIAAGKATITAASSSFTAECEVEVKTVEAESLTFDVTSKELVENESFILNAAILPEGTTDKTVEWSVDDSEVLKIVPFDADDSDNIVSATVTSLKAGEAKITAAINNVKAVCSVSVKAKEPPVAPAKIGDYFYSDGTWSDGGLISINDDGTKPVWAENKPAPVEGKTVIGIVFQTDSKRFSTVEQQQGFTHGLVFCLKSAHGPGTMYTRYTLEDDFTCVGKGKLGSTWYNNLSGQAENAQVLATYPGSAIKKCPAFDWTHTDFVPAAPLNTSGWFIPSIGQLWDFMANLGGEEIALHLKSLRDYGYDVTYGMATKLSYDPIAKLNSNWALVPADQKDDLIPSIFDRQVGSSPKFNVCELMSSSLYSAGEDCQCCIFWLGDNGEFDTFMAYGNDLIVCHPILAF